MKRSAVLPFVCATVLFFLAPEARGQNPFTLTPQEEEFFEYESIVLTPLLDPRDEADEPLGGTDWRALYLAKIAKFEAFLKKYPNSLLAPEVKLHIAEFSKDVELPEIRPLRIEEYKCIASHRGDNEGSLKERVACIKAFEDATRHWRDPKYEKKAVHLLLGLVRDYDRVKRYSMESPHLGGFKWSKDDLGGWALFVLAGGADKPQRKGMLLLIQHEYVMSSELKGLVEKDLADLKDVNATPLTIESFKNKKGI